MQLSTEILQRGIYWRSIGGFSPLEKREHDAAERLRTRGYLKFYGGRRAKTWRGQFFEITQRGEDELLRRTTRRAR